MQTLQISEQKAFDLYPNASTEFKIMLEETFGNDFFKRKITDRVKSFEDACDVLKICNTALPDVSMIPEDQRKSLLAHYKLIIIIKALNEGWAPDWNNSNERKWFLWFYMNNPGFRFDVSYYYYSFTFWGGGARLCLKSEEIANYAGKQFSDLYKDLLMM